MSTEYTDAERELDRQNDTRRRVMREEVREKIRKEEDDYQCAGFVGGVALLTTAGYIFFRPGEVVEDIVRVGEMVYNTAVMSGSDLINLYAQNADSAIRTTLLASGVVIGGFATLMAKRGMDRAEALQREYDNIGRG